MADGRSASSQGMYQLAALGVTLALSIVGGLLSGFIVSRGCKAGNFFDDEEHFHEVLYDIALEKVNDDGTEANDPVNKVDIQDD